MYQMGGGNRKGWAGYRELVLGMGWPWSWLPSTPTVSERSTGKTMGYHADLMAEINAVSREVQDKFALQSHQKAARARKEGKFDAELCAVTLTDMTVVKADNIIRDKIDLGKLSSLPPVFRPPPIGTVTAATSSPLTDGASAVLVMSEAKAASLGYPTDISMLSYVKSGIDPHPQLLLAPARCIPVALRQAGLTLADIDLLEFHEAFSAQVLSTFKVLHDEGVGDVDMARVNVNGGSVAVGHPFAATGGRIVMGVCDEMRRRKARYALISVCAAGGIGGVMVLERTEQANAETQR
jgi:acetyl-CoA acyltransferase